MRLGVRWLVALLCCAVGLLGMVTPGADAAGSLGEGTGTSLEGALVTPMSPAEGEQVQAQREAQLASPEAAAERVASQTRYENLSPERAAKLASEVFPGLIDEPAGGPPRLSAGESIVGYLSDNAAQVSLPEGKHGAVESSVPFAVETRPGQRTPVNLALIGTGAGFEPQTPVVEVHIPRQLGDGVSLGSTGVSLTPVNAQGAALSGAEGQVDGAAVLYANAQTDADTVVKPTTFGFDADTLLRSVQSPEQLFFRVGLPEGASLVQGKEGGAVQVVDEGAVLAVVPAPSARDAAGTLVPVSMSVSGNVLRLSVDEESGEYDFPIDVDPPVIANENSLSNGWKWTRYPLAEEVFCSSFFGEESGALSVSHCEGAEYKPYVNEDFGEYEFTTHGESKITKFRAYVWMGGEGSGSEYWVRTYMAIAGGAYEVGPVELPYTTSKTWYEVSAAGSNGNTALYLGIAKEKGNAFTKSTMSASEVTIQQEHGPHAGWNTSSEVVGGDENPLHGSRWGSATSGTWGVQATGTDPGMGVKHVSWSSSVAPKWGWSGEAGGCEGLECPESWSEVVKLKGYSESLPEGEDPIEVKVEDAAGLASTEKATVKIDNTPPYALSLTGFPSTHEIADGQHILLKGSATAADAGMASLQLTMDGQDVSAPSKRSRPAKKSRTPPTTTQAPPTRQHGRKTQRAKRPATSPASLVALQPSRTISKNQCSS
jgi:hypothetical protein